MGIDSENCIVLTLSIHLYWSKWFELCIEQPSILHPFLVPLSFSCPGFVRLLLHHIFGRFHCVFFLLLAHPLIYVQRITVLWNWWIDNDLSLFDYLFIYDWVWPHQVGCALKPNKNWKVKWRRLWLKHRERERAVMIVAKVAIKIA